MSNAIMFSLRFLIIFFLFTIFLPSANGQPPECGQTFNCGLLKNISYPFWGGNNRPQSCGRYGFELLNCEEDQNPLMKIQGQDFLVLNISQDIQAMTIARSEDIQAMTIARSDLWDSPCTKNFINTTLDYDRFAYNAQTVRNMTIFYGCVSQSESVPNNFTCKIDGPNKDFAYFVVDSLPRPPRPVPNSTSCMSSIQVPISRMSLDPSPDNGTTYVQQVLKRGFEVEYKADLKLCNSCRASHGTCGSNVTSNDFLCFCGYNISDPQKCPDISKIRHVGTVIGFAIIAACATLLCLLWVLLCCIKNRIKNLIRNFIRKKNDRGLEAFIRDNGPLLVERYKFSEIRKMTKSFKDTLGHGGFGDVYKGYLRNGSPVAVKVLKASKGNGEDFINEVASISRTSHVNIVTLLGYCFEGQKKALIYEFMPNGSLEKYIYNENALQSSSLQLEVEQLLDIATGVARGLEYLHRGCNTRILHFDIKPHNILLDENFCPKISDFGLSKLCLKEESNVSMVDQRGTFGFVAPEVLSGRVSVKSDVYSYGMMVLEMVGRRKNINIRASHASEVYFPDWIYKRLKGGSNLGLPSVVTEEENDLARKMILVGLWCIQTKPSDRPSMSKVIEMLQGSIEALQIPPRPVLTSSPIRTSPESSTLPDVEQMTESIKDLIEERKTNTSSGNFQIWRPSSYLGS